MRARQNAEPGVAAIATPLDGDGGGRSLFASPWSGVYRLVVVGGGCWSRSISFWSVSALVRRTAKRSSRMPTDLTMIGSVAESPGEATMHQRTPLWAGTGSWTMM